MLSALHNGVWPCVPNTTPSSPTTRGLLFLYSQVKKPIATRWIFKLKPGMNGESVRHKARLVARGFEQRHGIEYAETFAPVVRWESIPAVAAIATHNNWPIHQMAVQTGGHLVD